MDLNGRSTHALGGGDLILTIMHNGMSTRWTLGGVMDYD